MVARMSAGKVWLYVVGSAVFVIAGLAVMSTGVGFIPGLLAVLVFGFFGVLALKQASNRQDVLTIDDHGVFDRRVMDRPVPWSEIQRSQSLDIWVGKVIFLDVGEDYLRFTDAPDKQRLLKSNQGFGRGLMINPAGLDHTSQQIIAALRAHLG